MIKNLLFFAVVVAFCLIDSQAQSAADDSNKATNQYTRPVLLEGTVIMDDGSPPDGSIPVHLFCHGSVFRQAYTSSTGGFNFQLGSYGARFAGSGMDASVRAPQRSGFPSSMRGSQEEQFGPLIGVSASRSVNLSGCRIYAVFAGFQSDVIDLGYRSVMDDSDLGVLVLHRRGGVRGTTVSVNTLRAPKRAKKAFENAQKELKKDDPDHTKAAKELRKAVKSYSEFAEAWNLLGEVHLELKDPTAARQAFERAIAEDANYVTPYLFLAKLEIEDEQWEKASEFSKSVLELNPYISLAHYFSAVAGYSNDRLDVAEESLKYLEESGEVAKFPVAHYLLGSILAQKGEFPPAAVEYRHFLEVSSNSQWSDELKLQLAQWESEGLIDPPVAEQTAVPSP